MNSVVVTGGALIVDATNVETINTRFPIKALSEINYSEYLGSKGLKYLTQATKMSLVASILAKEHAHLDEISPIKSGVVQATNLSSIQSVSEFIHVSLEEGVSCVSPMQGPNLILNASTARLGMLHKISGFNTTLTSGRVGAIDALEYGYNAIISGEVDVCFVAAVEEGSLEYVNWFDNAGLHGQTKGSLIDIAGTIILESEEHAKKRNAQIYGEILGFSGLFDTDALLKTGSSETDKYAELVKDWSGIYNICIDESKLESLSFSKDAEIINCADIYKDELYGASGIVQTIHSLNTFDNRQGIVLNRDWFGNYRSMMMKRLDNEN